MKDKKLRKIIFKLSVSRARLIDYIISEGETGSSDISKVFGAPIQSTSTTLGTLHNLGYLKRREIKSESGGCEYLYRAAGGLE
jgi:predicted transcriptional regulator